MNTIDRRAYEGDIVSRLRHWRGLHLAHYGELCEAAANEIERLREVIRRLADQDATLSVCDGNVTVTVDATLTDSERKAIEVAAAYFSSIACEHLSSADFHISATLRSLLTRLHSTPQTRTTLS
jgi:ribosomal protein L18E